MLGRIFSWECVALQDLNTQSETTGTSCFSILGLINAGNGDKFLGFKIHTTDINKQNPKNSAEGVIKKRRQE